MQVKIKDIKQMHSQTTVETNITPHRSLIHFNLREVWKYRDLLRMLVKRDFVTFYKQTILGPLWFVVQPVLTTLTFMLIFGNIAGISTDGIPQPLFYMSGITIWNYFADSLNRVSGVFRENQNIFGKVYFPRLVTPLSIVVSGLVKFGIQFLLFIGMLLYFQWFTEASIPINSVALLAPLLILLMALLSLGLGMLITSLTTKYRDLIFLLQFAIQLLMYATPVIYPLSTVPEKYRWIIQFNPITPIVETFKYGFLGAGSFSEGALLYAATVSLVVMLLGTLVFNRTERNFMDTI